MRVLGRILGIFFHIVETESQFSCLSNRNRTAYLSTCEMPGIMAGMVEALGKCTLNPKPVNDSFVTRRVVMMVAAVGGSGGRSETTKSSFQIRPHWLCFCGDPQGYPSSSPHKCQGSSGNPGPTLARPHTKPGCQVPSHGKCSWRFPLWA